ncbi:MAG: AEC family transporter [Acuticoccus sp.]
MNWEIFNVVAPVLLIAGIGYLFEIRGQGFHSASMSRLVMLLGTPALVFSSLTRTTLPAGDLLKTMLAALVVVLIGACFAVATLRLAKLPLRPYVASLFLPNSGNAGLPVVLFAFADEGLAIGAAFFFVIAMCQYVAVPVIMAGRFRVRAVLEQPLVWAILGVCAFKLTDTVPPRVIAGSTHILGGMTVPVMLVLLGGALARLRVGDVWMSLSLALVRLVIGVATGALVIILFGLHGVEAAALFLLSSMPAALVTYVFAERYQQSPERVAGLVVSSTVFTFALLPGLVMVAMRIAAT